jgi:hypothetical protein
MNSVNKVAAVVAVLGFSFASAAQEPQAIESPSCILHVQEVRENSYPRVTPEMSELLKSKGYDVRLAPEIYALLRREPPHVSTNWGEIFYANDQVADGEMVLSWIGKFYTGSKEPDRCGIYVGTTTKTEVTNLQLSDAACTDSSNELDFDVALTSAFQRFKPCIKK